jgi:thiol-disulfide isomerase/thioredoxin
VKKSLTRACVAVGVAALAVMTAHLRGQAAPDQIVRVNLAYRAPGAPDQPKPNFSPKGTQVPLKDVAANISLPAGARRPAKSGVIKVGPDQQSWIPVLITADADHPSDFCRLFLDRNRNGNFADDGDGMTAVPTQNDKTKAWWSSFNKAELSVPYAASIVEPYLVNFWAVRDADAPAPDILRYSVGSWRYGTATINGVAALVAAMDSDNDALFTKGDMWSVLEAGAPSAEKAVLSITEAHETSRFMFLPNGAKEMVLEFRSFSPDGRSIEFAVVDKAMTKAADRAPDDMLKDERGRPRATTPFPWGNSLDAALAQAKSSGKKVLIDFETTWCGPCHSMDEWIWTDAAVAAALNGGFVGVKLDGDIEKALVKRFTVVGYPTMVVLDPSGPSGKETMRMVGYQSSKEILERLAK